MIILNPDADEEQQEEILERVQQLVARRRRDDRPRQRLGTEEDLLPDGEAARTAGTWSITCTGEPVVARRDRARALDQQGRRAAGALHPPQPERGRAGPRQRRRRRRSTRTPRARAVPQRGGRGAAGAAAAAAGAPADRRDTRARRPEPRHPGGAPDPRPGAAPHRRRATRSARSAWRSPRRSRDESRQLGRPVQLLRRHRLRPPGRDGRHLPGQGPAHRRRRAPVLARVAGPGRHQAPERRGDRQRHLLPRLAGRGRGRGRRRPGAGGREAPRRRSAATSRSTAATCSRRAGRATTTSPSSGRRGAACRRSF